MLQIKDIRKQYVTGDLVQTALDGVSLTLRDNEFVAILGPSGSGKTTLLNIIGGLDRYDSGDLVINGISTQEYSDRDWDSYRNHTIGFVFQSYNLIPHQTVLANVELALTISGISKAERRRRAKKALEDVGLGDQVHKRPNQMSGGQMQRVAIARALVNNPDILLADEPTGALDSETSVQVMELLKEVSRDRLVVMVTHNPELAEEYANRIVRVKDGRILSDSNPYDVSGEELAPPEHKNMGKSSMSYLTALTLSFNNLWTKKARTLLTSFAGSIGIIGIALIMSLSTGFQAYIDKIQEDTLSNYPLTFMSESTDMSAYLSGIASSMTDAREAPEGTVVEQQMISQMFDQVGNNDLTSFKAYLDRNMDQVDHTINSIKYSYGVKPLIYSEDTTEAVIQVNPSKLFSRITGSSAMSAYMDSDIFYEMLDNREALESQYDVLQGRWPESYNEMIIVLQNPSQISDYMTYALGLRDAGELEEMMSKVMAGEEVEITTESMQWTYDELMGLKFRLVDASACYRYNEEYQVYEDMSGDLNYMRDIIDAGEELTIVGIVCAKDGVTSTALSAGIAYTSGLTWHVINTAAESELVKQQLADPSVDVFTGKEFGADDDSELSFNDMITVDQELLSSAFGMDISEDDVMDLLKDYLSDALTSIDVDTQPAQEDFVRVLEEMAVSMLGSYIEENADPETGAAVIAADQVQTLVDEYLDSKEAYAKIRVLSREYDVSEETFSNVYRPLLAGMVTAYIAGEIVEEQLSQIPEESIPDVTLPEVSLPDETFPEVTLPSETLPDFTLPEESLPDFTLPEESLPDFTIPEDVTLPDFTEPEVPETTGGETAGLRLEQLANTVTDTPDVSFEIDLSAFSAAITAEDADALISSYTSSTIVQAASAAMATQMIQSNVQRQIQRKFSGLGSVIGNYIGSAIHVDEELIASAFQFNMTEEELTRLMTAMSTENQEQNATANLRTLGYADFDEPVTIAVYFVDFASKEEFIDFVDAYNDDMEARGKEDQVISYTDLTGIMMSSVRTIIDSVSYVLIAFVSVSLIVSSIMIGIITYISVMERTKEIGVLRAIGASKRNISQVFNAETFIIGLCSGLLGVGVTLVLIPLINQIIHNVSGNMDINAQLPFMNALVLVVLSMILTIIGGLIPSRKAAQKDPVIALRTE